VVCRYLIPKFTVFRDANQAFGNVANGVNYADAAKSALSANGGNGGNNGNGGNQSPPAVVAPNPGTTPSANTPANSPEIPTPTVQPNTTPKAAPTTFQTVTQAAPTHKGGRKGHPNKYVLLFNWTDNSSQAENNPTPVAEAAPQASPTTAANTSSESCAIGCQGETGCQEA